MNARDLMTTAPLVVTPRSALNAAAEAMSESHVGLIPVVDDVRTMRLVGVLADRQMIARCTAQHHAFPCDAAHHMTTTPRVAVRPDDSVRDVLCRMDQVRLSRLPVVDDAERVIGIIAQGDVIHTLSLEARNQN